MRFDWFPVPLVLLLLIGSPGLPSSSLFASDRVLTSEQLHGILLEKARDREENRAVVERVLSHSAASRSLLPLEKIRAGVASLDDAELERLAKRAERIEENFAAGQLTNQQLTYVVIGLAAAVLVLIIVAA